MKRLYYLVPSIDSVQEISDDLHQQGVTDWRFHIISKDEAGLYTRRLHSAGIMDRTDLVRFLDRGAIIGALAGICLVAALMLLQRDLPVEAWVAMFIFSIIAGAWIGGIGGISSENYRTRCFHDAIESGKYLVMVDVPKQHVERTIESMKKNHPDAELQKTGSSFNRPLGSDGESAAV